MESFVPGQCWISDAELKLGLGTIQSVEQRRVNVFFMGSGESRTYAVQSAPLTRVEFVPGDKISSIDGIELEVSEVENKNGLFIYQGILADGARAEISENKLNPFMTLNRPSERFFNNQIDHNKWFNLRYQSILHKNHSQQSDYLGLLGPRTSLIPHQLYIAHEVANRYAPRVLLADEVGLGKTIEAGLILHQQILSGRVKRALIVVPESLLHQWLIEMLRRFNLSFSLFDEERCLAEQESSGQDNPFDSAQLVLCHLEFLVDNPERHAQALEAEWDMLIVDEAHHLQWEEQQSSPEYECIEQLAEQTQGVLLLTATPEQLGKESHFARLRLLDAERFPSYEQFLAEEKQYQPLAHIIENLLEQKNLSDSEIEFLNPLLSDDEQALITQLNEENDNADIRQELIHKLLDRHGTGRVLYRNTRSAVSGFPERQQNPYPLETPLEYKRCLQQMQNTTLSNTQLLLSPELLYQGLLEQQGESSQDLQWMGIDTRVSWLADLVQQLAPKKVLVICANAITAQDLNKYLKQKAGINSAVFHEYLNLVERDRAAAYFADMEEGSQVLICSEIGSEGRNFQFSHHLVLFDLPLNPDLLEQRIGRLDRIGQRHDIQIHLPYLKGTAQEVLYTWYQDGLGAFEQNCPAGHKVYSQVKEVLVEELHQIDDAMNDLPNLIETSRKLSDEYNLALQQGRDQLLEYNSCRPQQAQLLLEEISLADSEGNIQAYLDQVFDCFGVDSEYHSAHSFVIRPGDRMQQSFPGLPDDGMTYTTRRETALSNEDMQFLSWEHPILESVMDMVLSNERGNTGLASLEHPQLEAGSLLLECLYVVESPQNKLGEESYHLAPELVRVLVDANGRDLSEQFRFEDLSHRVQKVQKQMAKQVISAYTDELRQLLSQAEQYAQQQVPQKRESLKQRIAPELENEVERLEALKAINPNVREVEIDFFKRQLEYLNISIDNANLRLDAMRVLIAT